MSAATTYVSSSLSSKDKATCQPSTNPPQLPQTVPPGFDPQLAYLLGLCCNSANDQYTAYVTNTPIIPKDSNVTDPNNWGIASVKPKPWDPDFSEILSQGYKPNPIHCNLSVHETDATSQSVEIPAGFIVRLDPTDTKKSSMIVVAFHGTQNSFELNKIDYDIVPAAFGGVLNLGSVHGGFYAQYTTGPDGQGDLTLFRAAGSLAQQIYQYFNEINIGNESLSVKVTGHSLGGALATLSALDIAYNFNSTFKSISMYSLAGPRVADAWLLNPSAAGTFVSNYQQRVPDSYRIVNTVDPVPNAPSAIFPPPPHLRLPPPTWIPTNVCAHVLGDNDAIIHKIVSSNTSLDQNVVSFTDENPQNGDSPMECQGPHSCPAVYVPFLERLASAHSS